jgi:glycosyltransferase involved in cell wall biosynthesis
MITSKLIKINSKTTISHHGIKNSIVHYGSINTFFGNKKIRLPHKSNKIIVSWFHVVPNDARCKLINKALKFIDIWHTSCEHTKTNMVNLGIPKDKIVVIPLGIDLNYFTPISTDDKSSKKKLLNIPNDKLVIGSFQKDGNGWGEGLEPKLIKGPDIFCDVVEKLSKKYDIFVLLTGPARGYVKKRLDDASISYKHEFFDDPNEVAEYFKAIDLYMVTSREEGGPKSILESMACGIPLISTKVGMAEDIIENGKNGFLVDIENIDGIYNKVCDIIDNSELSSKLVQNGLKTIVNYDWNLIVNKYYEKLYKDFK